MKHEEIEARLVQQKMRAPRPALREEILVRAAEAARTARPRPWFAYAVTATIVLALVVGQVADRLQSRRLAALLGPMPAPAIAAQPGGRNPGDAFGIASLLRRQAEIGGPTTDWPNGRAGG